MYQWEREYYVARIISGTHYVRIGENKLYLIPPTPEQRLIAAEVYRDARENAALNGALSDKEMLDILIDQNLWSDKEDDELVKLTKALEDLKVGLFENRLRSNARVSIRTALKKTRDEISRLENIRHGLDYLTIDGLAVSAKYRYLVGATLRGRVLLDPLIDKVVEIISHERLDEVQYRDLVKNEPWRSIWGAKSHSGKGLFGCSAIELSDEQRNLILWSTIYDNVREHPDCPNDSIINDDDMLDGWMIVQKRKRESQVVSQEAERIGNIKIRNSDEQYIFVDTSEDAREVEKMNDEMAASTKAKRMAYLKKKGEVNEVNMPDTAQKISMEFNRLEQMKMRQGK